MINPLKNHRGTSLPIVIGLIVLLALASAAINQLIIRNLEAVQKIEASNRAYMAAEAGLEDALYELSPRLAGYETPALDGSEGAPRSVDFGGPISWTSDWEIKNISNSNSFDGRFFAANKLTISLFNDQSGQNAGSFIQKDANIINAEPVEESDINTLSPTDFSITFRIPENVYKDSAGSPLAAFSNGLIIDNDGDAWENGLSVNEDGIEDRGYCGVTGIEGDDADCDDRVDEDSEEDVVIYWRITDSEGNELRPLEGCLNDDGSIQDKGSEICEKDFQLGTNTYEVTIDESLVGHDDETTIGQFISNAPANSQLKMEFLITSPLEQVDTIGQRKISIPYLEYTVNSTDTTNIPLPYFTIKSDGWFREFKQSLTTTVRPETVAPLFEFTILQQ